MRCVALFSGGLDSQLAVRLMQEQGIEVEAINFKTIFSCCQDLAGQTARELGVRLTVISTEDDYLDLIKEPRFGHGKGANPCVDCRIYMFSAAKKYMDSIGAQFIVSGEVIGQRPKSQKGRDLEIIAYHSDLDDLLLRPLSAKWLRPTLPEREGWVDREQLYDFSGRSRKGLIALARQLGITDIPQPSTGCALTEPRFSQKVFDLITLEPNSDRWDFSLLNQGRHYRYDETTKVVVGRRESENEALRLQFREAARDEVALLEPRGFAAPVAILVGPVNPESLHFAGGLLVRHSKNFVAGQSDVLVTRKDQQHAIEPTLTEQARQAQTLAS